MYLNRENIALSTADVEYHPLHPFIPTGCKVLFLGSFPPQRKRWCVDFFYPNYINDHWRIEGLIFFDDKNHFVDEKKKTFRLHEIVDFLKEKGIGFFDTATAVRRLQDNASDKFLEVVEPTDVTALLLQAPECKVVVVTGEKAATTLSSQYGINAPKVGEYVPFGITDATGSERKMYLYRLPSSSRAYPLSLIKKAEAYKKMFEFCGLYNE